MIVMTEHVPVLVDREALALLTGRSVHTIRMRCEVYTQHRSGRPLYDMERAVTRLAEIPTRRRTSA